MEIKLLIFSFLFFFPVIPQLLNGGLHVYYMSFRRSLLPPIASLVATPVVAEAALCILYLPLAGLPATSNYLSHIHLSSFVNPPTYV